MPRRALPVVLLVAVAGCNYHVWSPPAQALPLAGVGALEREEVRLAAQGSYSPPIDVFDDRPDAAGAALGFALGLGDDLDLRLGGQLMHLAGGAPSTLDRNIWAGRAGLRWAPEPWIAADVGLGAGAHVAGAFVSPDIGLTLGYDEQEIGFFVDFRVGASVPVDPGTIELTRPDDEERHFATPVSTVLLQLTPGMRFTLVSRERSEVGLELRISPSVTMLADNRDYSFWVGGGLGLELSFGGEGQSP